MMHHRLMTLLGLAVLLLEASRIWFGYTAKPSGSSERLTASFFNAHTEQLASALEKRVKDEIVSYLSSLQANDPVKGEPRLTYSPAYGPEGRVAIQIRVDPGHQNEAGRAQNPGLTKDGEHNRKYLVLSYALIRGRWVEIEHPHWEEEGPPERLKKTVLAEDW